MKRGREWKEQKRVIAEILLISYIGFSFTQRSCVESRRVTENIISNCSGHYQRFFDDVQPQARQ
jgi:hypothetical protein